MNSPKIREKQKKELAEIHSLPFLAGVASQLVARSSAVSSGRRPPSGRSSAAASTVTSWAAPAATAAAAAAPRGRVVDPLLPAAKDGEEREDR